MRIGMVQSLNAKYTFANAIWVIILNQFIIPRVELACTHDLLPWENLAGSTDPQIFLTFQRLFKICLIQGEIQPMLLPLLLG